MQDYYLYINGDSLTIASMYPNLQSFIHQGNGILRFKASKIHQLTKSIKELKEMIALSIPTRVNELEASRMFIIGRLQHDRDQLDTGECANVEVVEVSPPLRELITDEDRFAEYLKLVGYMVDFRRQQTSTVFLIKASDKQIFEVQNIISKASVTFKYDMKTIVIEKCKLEREAIFEVVNTYKNKKMTSLDVSIQDDHIVFKTSEYTTIFFTDLGLYTLLFKMCIS